MSEVKKKRNPSYYKYHDPATRPKLSSVYVNDFYKKLENKARTDDEFIFLKEVFLAYTIKPEITPQELSKRTGRFINHCQWALCDILDIIKDIQEKDDKDFKPLTMVPVRGPRPYYWTDPKTGKRWICVNEFFGLR